MLHSRNKPLTKRWLHYVAHEDKRNEFVFFFQFLATNEQKFFLLTPTQPNGDQT